jgi:hypothetical protein
MARPPRGQTMKPNSQKTMSTSSSSSTGITVNITEQTTVAGPGSGPRRGGCSTAAWMCCACKFHNKIGRSVCSNTDKKKCAGKLSADKISERPKAEQGLNHRRCEACYPSGYGVYVNGHDRRWPPVLFGMEKENVDEDAEHELEDRSKRDFDKLLQGRKPKVVQRDPLTLARVGEWPM